VEHSYVARDTDLERGTSKTPSLRMSEGVARDSRFYSEFGFWSREEWLHIYARRAPSTLSTGH